MSWRIVNESLRPAYDRLFKSAYAVNQAEDYFLVNTPIDMEVLYQDEAFKNVIVRLRNTLSTRVKWVSKTLSELHLLIEEIDKETQRLSD
jgi:hypothetical protein